MNSGCPWENSQDPSKRVMSTLCPWLRSPWQQDQRPAGKLQLFLASAGKLACSQLCPPEISSQHWEPRFEPAHPLNSFVLCPQSVPRLTCPTIRFLTRGQKKMEVVAKPPGKVWLCGFCRFVFFLNLTGFLRMWGLEHTYQSRPIMELVINVQDITKGICKR